ncbi:MAG: type 4a pilus biogenesis protein PilO [Syntrophales bacterium]|jgi:type IV pilus assembly protein PilO|nr:type 4a pilus biogenesis protein PilO [Syntrophales bacterium]MCK9527508.1 type 4a pilus biogenesis protein PilO [Syntrophales bacterium]MDX9922565.1 type 4a pilus biogenesis protein PilO [Syntrophales bacterium]
MAITADDIKALPMKYKILIGVVLVLLLGYFYYFFFLQAALDKKASLTETLETLDRQIIQRQAVARQIERHRKEIEEINENLRLALAKLPEQKDIPSLLSALSGAAQTEKLDILLFEPLNPISQEFYAELPVKMTVRGNYRDIAAFFDTVSRLPRIVNVADAVIRGPTPKDAGGPLLLDAECLMKTYMFLEMTHDDPQKES